MEGDLDALEACAGAVAWGHLAIECQAYVV